MLISSKRKEKEKNAVSPYVNRKEKKKEEGNKKRCVPVRSERFDVTYVPREKDSP